MHPKTKSSFRRPSNADIDEAADALTQLANDPALVPGIYNYCDRWCERCPLTKRCLTFKMEQRYQGRAAGPGRTADPAAVWNQVALNFAVAGRLLEREAKHHGLDLEAIAAEVAKQPRRSRGERRADPLVRAATKYREAALRLLDRLEPDLATVKQSLVTEAQLGIGQPAVDILDLKDAWEIVHWYVFFIEVKLSRALYSVKEDAENGDDTGDGNGSAKIALIAIERSIGAWLRLRQHLPAVASEILDLLVQLERVRRAAGDRFPMARAFKRPGFDE